MRTIKTAPAVIVMTLALGAIPLAAAKTCRSGYTHATIAGKQECLHTGEYCSHAHASQYHRYHFDCEIVDGRYRLERPPKPAPAKPPATPPPSPAVEGPGSYSHATDGQFCSTHACISSFGSGSGYIVQCADGEWSHSGGLEGVCTDHGGVG